MMPDEKNRLLALFESEERWCQQAEARDERGAAVQYDDPAATAWDVTGALCHLFGWRRTEVLLGQVERHISGSKRHYRYNEDPVIASMLALQSYNDRPDTTFDALRSQLETMPVWSGAASSGVAGQ